MLVHGKSNPGPCKGIRQSSTTIGGCMYGLFIERPSLASKELLRDALASYVAPHMTTNVVEGLPGET